MSLPRARQGQPSLDRIARTVAGVIRLRAHMTLRGASLLGVIVTVLTALRRRRYGSRAAQKSGEPDHSRRIEGLNAVLKMQPLSLLYYVNDESPEKRTTGRRVEPQQNVPYKAYNLVVCDQNERAQR